MSTRPRARVSAWLGSSGVIADPRALPVPALWVPAIDEWALELAAASVTRETVKTRTDHLRRMARALGGDPWAVSAGELVEWVGRQAWARETRRSVYASLRSFYAHGERIGSVEVSPARSLPRVKASPPAPRPAGDVAVARALAVADARTTLILRLAGEAGLRRAEIAQVNVVDLVPDLAGWSLVVHGKGERERLVPITDELAIAIRTTCLAGGGFAFPGACAGHLSPRWVGKLATLALPDGVTLHQLRHRFATRAYRATNDLLSVSQVLGHASVATTQRYVKGSDDRLRAVVAAAA